MSGSEAAAPRRIVHLGLGAFFRAHQAWFTELANRDDPAAPWGIHAFTGRSPALADLLARQDCRYTLIERGPDGDTVTVVSSVVAASDGGDLVAWRAALADPAVGVVTLTITEAGYHADASGRPDLADATIRHDLALLRDAGSAEAPASAPARLVDGLRARRRAAAGPIAIVSCDNLPDNGRVTSAVVLAIADRVDPRLSAWIRANVSFVSTMVDRITPATTDDDRAEAAALAGFDDAMPVVCEPFAEWVLSGAFPAGRPRWEVAGARFVDAIEPYERRKLWLLNAGHSLLAYLGLARGHETIDEAMADAALRASLDELWLEASEVLPFPQGEIAEVLDALRSRFANPRIRHRLDQIGAGGSLKLPPRILDVHRRRRAAGLPAGRMGPTVIAAWIEHLRRDGSAFADPAAESLAAELRVAAADPVVVAIRFLAPDLESDAEFTDAVRTALASTPIAQRGLLT